MAEFIAFNAAAVTTAGLVKVTTGTAIKTLLQIAVPAATAITIVEWGITYDGSVAGTPILTELIETGAIAATVTTHTTATCYQYDSQDGMLSHLTMGTTATGYTSSGEGAIVATRPIDVQMIAPSAGYKWQFPLGERPRVGNTGAARILRIRVTTAVAVNAICYIIWNEN